MFWLWDSLPHAVQLDSAAMNLVWRVTIHGSLQGWLISLFSGPGESLEMYAPEISWLVSKAFPEYCDNALREEKHCCFVAGLDPMLEAQYKAQGATDLEEAVLIAGHCDNAGCAGVYV